MKKLIDEKIVFRSEVMGRKYIIDEIQRIISYIKDELQISIEKMYWKEEKGKILLVACGWTEAIARYKSYGKLKKQ